MTEEAKRRVGLLDRVQILTLQVLGEGDLQILIVGQFADDGREGLQARSLGGAVAPLPGDEFVNVPASAD